MQMTANNPEATYVSINKGYASCPPEISSQSICIDGDIRDVLNQL